MRETSARCSNCAVHTLGYTLVNERSARRHIWGCWSNTNSRENNQKSKTDALAGRRENTEQARECDGAHTKIGETGLEQTVVVVCVNSGPPRPASVGGRAHAARQRSVAPPQSPGRARRSVVSDRALSLQAERLDSASSTASTESIERLAPVIPPPGPSPSPSAAASRPGGGSDGKGGAKSAPGGGPGGRGTAPPPPDAAAFLASSAAFLAAMTWRGVWP